ncbi:DMT family transporter [Algicola sagamiensis]|uniref:DMT family transporter n=1 Tax=Algicola sagamiensis TaxID=163869 RepID=UPI00035F3534|nr:DMT family transporter [Algicola sagamiensis]
MRETTTSISTPDSPKPQLKQLALIHLSLILVQLGFASLHVEGKWVMGPDFQVTPFALAMMRIGGAALIFIPLHLMLKTPKVSSWKEVRLLFILSILGIVNNQALYLAGLNITSAISATLLIALIPVFTVMILFATGKMKLSIQHLGGVMVALLGIGILIGFALPQLGDTLVLLNAISFALYVIYSKDLLERLGALTVMAWVFGIGTIIFLPFGISPLVQEAPHWSTGAWWLVVYIVLVPSVLVYMLNGWALKRASADQVTTYIFLQPLGVVLLSWLQFDMVPTTQAMIAAVVVVVGVSMVLTAKR